jgi:hypothetical protein
MYVCMNIIWYVLYHIQPNLIFLYIHIHDECMYVHTVSYVCMYINHKHPNKTHVNHNIDMFIYVSVILTV